MSVIKNGITKWIQKQRNARISLCHLAWGSSVCIV